MVLWGPEPYGARRIVALLSPFAGTPQPVADIPAVRRPHAPARATGGDIVAFFGR